MCALYWGLLREMQATGTTGVVCLTCGTEQPYWRGSSCMRGGLLGIECSSNECQTIEAYSESVIPSVIPTDA